MKLNPELSKSAVCGLFCPSCSVYIATQEDESRLEILAKKLNQSVEDTRCNGCRSDRVSTHCRECNFKKCAEEKNILFCSECNEFPCEELKIFQAERPHRVDLWNYLKSIKEVGYEKWFGEMEEEYTCSNCGTINSAYDLKCRKCNTFPSSNFIEKHSAIIKKALGLTE